MSRISSCTPCAISQRRTGFSYLFIWARTTVRIRETRPAITGVTSRQLRLIGDERGSLGYLIEHCVQQHAGHIPRFHLFQTTRSTKVRSQSIFCGRLRVNGIRVVGTRLSSSWMAPLLSLFSFLAPPHIGA